MAFSESRLLILSKFFFNGQYSIENLPNQISRAELDHRPVTHPLVFDKSGHTNDRFSSPDEYQRRNVIPKGILVSKSADPKR